MITRWSHGWYLRFYWNLKKILSRQFQLYPSYGSKFITLWILQKIDQNFLLSEPSKILESNNLPKKKNYFSTPCSLPPKSAIFIISFHWKCLVFELKFVKNEKKKKKIFKESGLLFWELWNTYKWFSLWNSYWYCLPHMLAYSKYW